MTTHRQSDNTYRGWDREVIDANPVLELAWSICQITDDDAPLRWGRHVMLAECLLDNYTITKRSK